MPEPRIIKAASPEPELQLVTIPRVHLASVGRWTTSTGIWECSAEDLAAIVEAADDPGLRTPILKLGHRDRLSQIEIPAVGRIENLVLSDDGLELFGDYVGLPKWLAEALPTLYPSRSVEVALDHTGSTGHDHAAVLTAVALLGETTPAIESLDDVHDLLTGELQELVEAAADVRAHSQRNIIGAPPDVVRAAVDRELRRRLGRVEASVSVDTVRQAFYDALSDDSRWAWIREIYVGDGPYLIVDDDEGDLYRIPWSESSGTVTFATPERVVVQYVPAPAEDDAAEGLVLAARFAGTDPRLIRASEPDKPQEGTMELSELLAEVGLPADATMEQYTARLGELGELAAATADVADPPVAAPPGTVVLDEAAHAELVEAAGLGAQAFRTIAERDRDAFLNGAVQAGRFPVSRREHYLSLWEADPEGTRTLIEGLEAGLIPTTGTPLGVAATVEAAGDDEALWQSSGLDAHFANLANVPQGA